MVDKAFGKIAAHEESSFHKNLIRACTHRLNLPKREESNIFYNIIACRGGQVKRAGCPKPAHSHKIHLFFLLLPQFQYRIR